MGKTRAFIRYIKGKLVPGSLIFTGGEYPKAPFTAGKWQEVPADLCCDSGGGTFTTEVVFPTSPEFPGVPFLGIGFRVRCNSNPVISYFIEYPLGTNTTQEVVDYLNPLLSGVASFTVVNGTTISVSFSQVIADALCPSGTLTVEPSIPA
jgi:hypothetical protein